MSKALVPAAVLPPASRAFRSDARRISSSSGEARGVRFFFLILSSRDDPLLSREHTHRHHLVVVPTHPFPHPQVVERSRKDRDETKENKIVLSPKRAFLPFFRRRYFFSRRKYLDPLLFFFSSNTLNVPKTLNKKFKKKRSSSPRETSVFCVCVCVSLSRLQSNHGVARRKAEQQQQQQQQHTASSSSS